MIVATAGHVDHGKTTLVAALTGVDTDRLPEEKKRGLTIDLGFAYQQLPGGGMIGFVDVPGHERFVHNMLAGVAGVDSALLVVAADDGPMPQTREHLAILDLLGIRTGVVALTKTDRVDADRVEVVKAEIKNLLAQTSLAGSTVFPVSSHTGSGIEELREYLQDMTRAHQNSRPEGRFRLAIDRCFSVSGAGLVVTGTVYAGTVKVGDQLVLSPRGTTARVRSIRAQNRDSDVGTAGDRLGLNISAPGLHRDYVHRGDWLLEGPVSESTHMPTKRLDIKFRMLEGDERPLRNRSQVHLHLGAVEVTARVTVLDRDQIGPGAQGLVQLVLDKEIATLRGDRLILRDSGAQRTIGGGEVIDPFAPARKRTHPERLQWLGAMSESSPADALRGLLVLSSKFIDFRQFSRIWNLTADDAQNLLTSSGAVRTGTREVPLLISAQAWQKLGAEVVSRLEQWHRDNPGETGLSEEQLRRTAFRHISAVAFHGLVEDAKMRGGIVVKGARLGHPKYQQSLNHEDETLWSRVQPLLQDGGLQPPVVRELAKELDMELQVLEQFCSRAEKIGLLYSLGSNRYFLPETVRHFAVIVRQVASESPEGSFDAKSFKNSSGIGRNLTIEVLEHFDEIGLTRRQGRDRRVLKKGSKMTGFIDV